MSNLLSQASLVMIPSGYKEDVVYSQIPTDGSGDLSFTRASNGTRINSAGLVEDVPWNLVLQSVWPSIGTGVAPTSWTVGTGPATNFSAGPLAGQLVCNTSGNRGFIQQSVSLTAGEYALSVFVDSVTTTGPIAQMISIFGSTNVKYYEDGIEVTASTSIVAGQRYTVVGTVTTASFNLRIGSGITGNTTANYVVSRPQLVEGSVAKPYFPTTDRLNVPRLTYQNGGGGCPSLLLEPQRTNLVTFSEQFDNASWAKGNSGTITANSTISPDGTQTADTLNAGANSAQVQQAPTGTSGAVYTVSIWVKRITGTGNVFLIAVEKADTLIAVTSDWQRFTATVTSTTTAIRVGVKLATSGDAVAIWGAQLEAGAYPTTYIPTTTASATRIADSFSRNNIYTNGLITSSGGTWFVELRNNIGYTRDGASSGVYIDTNANGQSTGIAFLTPSGGGRVRIWKLTSGSFSTLYNTTTDTTKIAIKWDGTTVDIFANGTKVVSATSFTATNMEYIGARIQDVPYFIQQMALYPSPLSDTDCTTITSL